MPSYSKKDKDNILIYMIHHPDIDFQIYKNNQTTLSGLEVCDNVYKYYLKLIDEHLTKENNSQGPASEWVQYHLLYKSNIKTFELSIVDVGSGADLPDHTFP